MTLSVDRIKSLVILIISTIGFASIWLLGMHSPLAYGVVLFLIYIGVFFSNERKIITANIFFLAFFLYKIAIGPFFLLYEKMQCRYQYDIVILGCLLCFAWGDFVAGLSNIRKKYVGQIINIKFKFSRAIVITLLWLLSVLAGLYYIYLNRVYLFSGNIENGRVDSLYGNGLIIQLSQLSIVLIPMLYEVYFQEDKIQYLKYKVILINMVIISSVLMLFQGYRTPVLTLVFCLSVVYVQRNKVDNKKIFMVGCAMVIIAEILGLVRKVLSGIHIDGSYFFVQTRSSMIVSCVNIDYCIKTFPYKVPFQNGRTYFMNFSMLKPGADQDFTMWLKEQIGISFDGGGLAPSIIGEFYLNFGNGSYFIGMFLLGVFGVALYKYYNRMKGDFFAVYLIWQFAHSASGGIGNVLLPVVLHYIVYRVLIMFKVSEKLDDYIREG